jgi:methionyl-tRNA formyltransferase
LRLAFAGTPRFAVPALDALSRTQHTIEAVFTQPDRPAGRGRSLQESAVKHRAAELGLPVHQPASFKTPDVEELLRTLALDALVVVAYGLIVPSAALAIPRLGCFNIHASLLPRWRGAAPIQRALLAGDTVTGVTIMRMEAGLDTGPMLMVRQHPMRPRETAETLHDRLALIGGEAIVEALAAVADGSSREVPQPTQGVTYAAKIDKSEAMVDWSGAAASIVRQVRAFDPWPVAETRWNGTQLRIWEAELGPPAAADAGLPGSVLAASRDGIDVACGMGVLRILRLQLAGRKPLAVNDFIRSQPLAAARFGSP